MTFGELVAKTRKEKGLSQKNLAVKIIKSDDGKPITPQYLNDIEHDRRNPPSGDLIEQFASVLGISSDILYGFAGRLPDNILKGKFDPQQIQVAFKAFRKQIKD